MEYDIHLSDATIKKLMADTGDSGGGESGGDSDLSTAEITFKPSTNDVDPIEYFATNFPVIYNNTYEPVYIDPIAADFEPFTVLIPLYKGSCKIMAMSIARIAPGLDEGTLDITGECTYDAETGLITITGDCIIGCGFAK